MAFVKGRGKVPGSRRPPGTVHKITELENFCKIHHVNFMEQLVKIAKDTNHPSDFAAVREGCQYFMPKQTMNTLNIDTNLQALAEEFAKMTTEELQTWIKANGRN